MDTKSIDVRFYVTSDLYHLTIHDTSCWGVAINKPAVLEIELPGSSKHIALPFSKGTVTYDAVSLGLVCGDSCNMPELQDGVYKFKLKASPSSHFYEVYYAKLDQLQKNLDIAITSELENECQDCKRDELLTLEYKKLQIEALVRRGERKKAQSVYASVKRRADKLINCKNC